MMSRDELAEAMQPAMSAVDEQVEAWAKERVDKGERGTAEELFEVYREKFNEAFAPLPHALVVAALADMVGCEMVRRDLRASKTAMLRNALSELAKEVA